MVGDRLEPIIAETKPKRIGPFYCAMGKPYLSGQRMRRIRENALSSKKVGPIIHPTPSEMGAAIAGGLSLGPGFVTVGRHDSRFFAFRKNPQNKGIEIQGH